MRLLSCTSLLLLVSVSIASFRHAPLEESDIAKHKLHDIALECGIRSLAFNFSSFLLGQEQQSVFDALRLGSRCNYSTPSTVSPLPYATTNSYISSTYNAANYQSTFIVDATKGNDANGDGSLNSPYKTIARALRATRGALPPSAILLRSGTYYLGATGTNGALKLNAIDSGLLIATYPADVANPAVISGGIPLTNLVWQPYLVGVEEPWNTFTDLMQDCPSTNPGQDSPECGIQFAGIMQNYSACMQACNALGVTGCRSYTWHDSQQGKWAFNCFIRTHNDDLPSDTAYSGHYSGSNLNIYVADLSSQAGLPTNFAFNSLFNATSNRRFVRARWPNGNVEEFNDVGSGQTGPWTGGASWGPPLYPTFPPPTQVEISSPSRPWDPFFPNYQLGIEGTAIAFDPPQSFWGTQSPPAGNQFNVPSSLTTPTMLPPRAQNFTVTDPNNNAPITHAFHALYWGGWSFPISSSSLQGNTSSGPLALDLGWTEGGWQEARGSSTGSTYYFENSLSQLDAPGEWYYDAQAQKLYMFFNSTPPLPTDESFLVAAITESLIELRGSQQNPVVGVVIANLTLAHTATTFLHKYAVGSGGDFSYYAGGGIVLQGTENVTITGSTIAGIGGNGIALLDYNLGASITGNEIMYIGDSAILSAGHADGIDGTAYNVPSYTSIQGNLIHEIAMYTVQAGAVYQTLTNSATIANNVLFSGNRAGINVNDGAYGAHNIHHNLGFNWVRTTSDHGNVNSWSRQITLSGNSSVSLPETIQMHHNFFINNYFSTWPIDFDDGSRNILCTYNFLPFGGGKNYLGMKKTFENNFFVYPDGADVDLMQQGLTKDQVYRDWYQGVYGETIPADVLKDMHSSALGALHFPYCYGSGGSSTFPSDLRDGYMNNTCVVSQPGNIYSFDQCSKTTPDDGTVPFLSYNTLYVDNNEYQLSCGGTALTLAQAQAIGFDIGTTVSQSPSSAGVLALCQQFVLTNLMV